MSVFRKENRWLAKCKCEKGHIWTQKVYSLVKGQWCWECSHQSPNATIDKMREIAVSRGGECLSALWRGNRKKLRWQCSNGHVWHAIPNSVASGRWCPECATGISERLCRAYFEAIFKTPFPPAWPVWLINAQGNRMEIDGFSQKLSLGFEFQGHQHYKHVKTFQKSVGAFKRQRSNDSRKSKLCRMHGINLLHIPYTVPLESIPEYIKSQCNRFGIAWPKLKEPIKVDLKKAYSPSLLEGLRAVANSKKGDIISTNYSGVHKRYKWICGKGHIWEASAASVKSGSWCPECSGKKKWEIGAVREWALANGMKCLSSGCKNNKDKLKWACKCGYLWEAQWNSVHSGSRCPRCAINRRRKPCS